MNRRSITILLAIVILALAIGVYLLRSPGGSPSGQAAPQGQARLVGLPTPQASGSAQDSGFARADGPRPLSFPADFGPHPDYQTEWWYYTGNLEAASGEHFGFQLTFFRRALLPASQRLERQSDWATQQVYLAHFTLTDVTGKTFQAYERLERGSAGLAGARSGPAYRVWLDDWSVEQTGPQAFKLQASSQGFPQGSPQGAALSLSLVDAKGPVLQGDNGYSQKGSEPGNASYYFSQTRLVTSGTVSVNGKAYPVTGLSWMDHEFGTSALAPGQIGWNWFALQLDSGAELMIYTFRDQNGAADPFSSGTLIAPDGSTRHLGAADFSIRSSGTWRSPHSSAVYPSSWTVEIPSVGLKLEIQPYLADQELNLSFTYWEGAVRVTGTQAGATLTGSGYVELTGYAHSMQGRF